ncbi:SagB/ThcOx family dehydrogenase [Flavobacterium sp. JP2137]|uniref:SagB/ThcOx family dehydrogenase n=1 Tax=Flavobacterium sp. JP2137 TaxID=3414510 RepID=UPI003D2FBA5C
MTQHEILNILSEHRLHESTLDFLELIKFQKYHTENLDRFKVISYVNNNPTILKKIYENYYEIGFCNVFDLHTSENKSDRSMTLEQINKKRKSTRSFSNEPLTFEEISDFFKLFYSITGKETINYNGTKLTRDIRNIASGGALYPTEIYIFNHKISKIPLGVYRYNVLNFQLELIKELKNKGDFKDFYEIIMKSENNPSVLDFENASAFIVFTSVLNKHSFKYQDFGVLLSFIEIGEFIHAAYLAVASLDLACCVFGGFFNNKMNEYLELKNTLHQPILCMAIGNNKT